MTNIKPFLVLCWGNPSRGDDAIGPQLADCLEQQDYLHVEVICDYQLQIEYAADLQGRQQVLFIDAGINTEAPFKVSAISRQRDQSISSHALSPQALLQVYKDVFFEAPPPARLMTVRGYEFELGQDISAMARGNLFMAIEWLNEHLSLNHHSEAAPTE